MKNFLSQLVNGISHDFYAECFQYAHELGTEIMKCIKIIVKKGEDQDFVLRNIDFSVSPAMEKFYNANVDICDVITAIFKRLQEDIDFREAYELLKILEYMRDEIIKKCEIEGEEKL